jgi:hypothetical protein
VCNSPREGNLTNRCRFIDSYSFYLAREREMRFSPYFTKRQHTQQLQQQLSIGKRHAVQLPMMVQRGNFNCAQGFLIILTESHFPFITFEAKAASIHAGKTAEVGGAGCLLMGPDQRA